MSEAQSADNAPRPVKVVTEYAILSRRGNVLSGPTENPRWNESITLHDAVQRWFPGAIVGRRTRTVYLSEWERIPPGQDADA